MTDGQVLAAAGTTASILSMTGNWITHSYPVLGPALAGGAGFVMLVWNLVVLFRPSPAPDPVKAVPDRL